MVDRLVLDPPLAILAGLVASCVVYLVVAKAWAGMLWPRGRVAFQKYWRWVASLIMGWLAFYYTTVLLMPDKMDVEPCKSVWKQTPNPAGAWFYVFYGVVLLSMGLIYLAYVKTRDQVDWCV